MALYEPKDRGVQADWAVSIEAEAMSWDAAEAYDRGYDEARASLDVDRLRAAIDAALHELGVPGPGYPAPVANAVDILRAALRAALEEPTPLTRFPPLPDVPPEAWEERMNDWPDRTALEEPTP